MRRAKRPIGRYRYSVEILRMSKVEDGAGGFTKQWLSARTTLGDFRPMSTSRAITRESMDIMRRAELEIRQAAAPGDFGPQYRVKVNGRTWKILAMSDPMADGERWSMVLSEVEPES